MSAQQYRALQGFRDILPDEQPYWRFVEQTAVAVAELYGYRRIETPILEETGVFLKTSGETSDVVEHQMYTFEDRPGKEGRGQSLTLRPEGTAGVVRAYLEHGMFKLPQPVKLYYLSEPMFRHERPQAGRYRQHHQFGCEALGESDPAIDAELIALLYQVYRQLGLHAIRVQLNSIGDPVCRPRYVEALRAYYRPLLDQCCHNCQSRFQKNPLRLLDCKEPQDQAKIAAAPRSVDYLCQACHEHFERVQRFLSLYEVPFELNPLLVRGLDYYTRTVFEFTSETDNTALNGGGRYDGLAELLGGPPTPGIGFGMGIERVILELKRQGIVPPAPERPRAFVVYMGKEPALKEAAVRLIAELRHAGIKAEMSYGDRSPKAQMKQANASGASYALIMGEEELAREVVTVRALRAEEAEGEGRQIAIPRTEILGYLQNLQG
uniref:Histidine--tRNA ligase n=1 Tax=Thermogemmatispora argillosa TaxID=2045280 RepID=A0A455T7C6_9CHLR|nr:histidine--tRNA ligase [Thermogemmatispora argillosa]